MAEISDILQFSGVAELFNHGGGSFSRSDASPPAASVILIFLIGFSAIVKIPSGVVFIRVAQYVRSA